MSLLVSRKTVATQGKNLLRKSMDEVEDSKASEDPRRPAAPLAEALAESTIAASSRMRLVSFGDVVETPESQLNGPAPVRRSSWFGKSKPVTEQAAPAVLKKALKHTSSAQSKAMMDPAPQRVHLSRAGSSEAPAAPPLPETGPLSPFERELQRRASQTASKTIQDVLPPAGPAIRKASSAAAETCPPSQSAKLQHKSSFLALSANDIADPELAKRLSTSVRRKIPPGGDQDDSDDDWSDE